VSLRTKQSQGICDAAHWALVKAIITSEGSIDASCGHSPNYQTHRSPGISTINYVIRLCKAPDTHSMHRPRAGSVIDHLSPESPHCLAGIEDIVAFKQTLDFSLSN
jgi:hypothetical protein